MKRPLLSICIPTYNRGLILDKCLNSIVNNRFFNEDIEVIISDNTSTDNTEEIGNSYAKRYSNVKYFRNNENVSDQNFILSLDRGSGAYLKLMKDNLLMSDFSLCYLLGCIKNNIGNKIPIFFTNGVLFNSKTTNQYFCENFDDFIIHSSYQITAITYFGCWREDWGKIKNKNRFSGLQLSQDDWIYQLMEKNKQALLCNKKYYSMYEIGKGKRSGYNWFKVHVDNYYEILNGYVKNGLISERALTKEKSICIMGLRAAISTKYFLKIYSSWNFDMTGASKILWSHFKYIPKFYWVMITLPFWGSLLYLENRLRDLFVKYGWWDYMKKKILRKEI